MSKLEVKPEDPIKTICDSPVTDENDRSHIHKLIEGVRGSSALVSAARDNIAFKYMASIAAYTVAIGSGKMQLSTDLERVVLSTIPLLLGIIGSISIIRRARQHRVLLHVLVHLENLLGMYKPGAYRQGTTLLPHQWLDSGKYISTRHYLEQVAAIVVLSALSVILTWAN